MEQILVITAKEWKNLMARFSTLEQKVEEMRAQLPQWVRAPDAVRLAGLSRRGLELERKRPGSLIRFTHEGRTVWYDRQSCLDHAKSKKLPIREREEFKASLKQKHK